MHSKSKKRYRVKISSILYIGIGTGSDKFNRKKTSTKMSSTVKVKDRREATTTINRIFVLFNVDVP